MTPTVAPLILVTTAGKIGAEASRLLAQRGTSVRVLVRNPEKVSALAQIGVEVCKGDLEDPATLDKATQGVTGVVLVSPACRGRSWASSTGRFARVSSTL